MSGSARLGDLAAFDDSSLGVRTEAWYPDVGQRVDAAHYKRVIRRYYGIVRLCFFCKSNDAFYIRRLDRYALSVSCYASVSGQSVDLADFRVLSEFFDDSVLSAAASDYENIHVRAPPYISGGTVSFL